MDNKKLTYSEDLLEKAKSQYLETRPTEYLMYHGWQDLSTKLPNRDFDWKRILLRQGIVFAAILIAMVGSLYGVSQEAKPGDRLYQVKVLGDTVFSKITGDYGGAIQKRASDLIGVSQSSNSSAVEDAKKGYQKIVEDAEKKAKNEGEKKDLGNVLNEQEGRFRQELQESPGSGKQLDDALRQTERVKNDITTDEDKGRPEREDDH